MPRSLLFLITFLLHATLGAAHSSAPAAPGHDTAERLVQYLHQAWGVETSGNNSVVLFSSGQEKFDDLFRAVRAARRSIHLEYFNFRNDSISAALFTLLAQKASEGVKVRALFDGFGNSSNNRPLKRRHLDSLRARGIEIYEFNPVRFPFLNDVLHRDHRKIVVIDGLIAYTGGMNVADYYIHGKPEFGEWHDIHARIEGDAVSRLQGIFLRFWQAVTSQSLSGTDFHPGERQARQLFPTLTPDTSATAGHKRVAVVNREPGYESGIMHDTFVTLIRAAQKQILIINPYFTLCRHIKRELKRACKRGVDVQIMVSEKSDIPVTPRIVEYNTYKLMRAGARVHIYTGGFHHSKVMMIDSCVTFLGSANLNSRSLSFDYECNLLIADTATTQQLQSLFHHDRATRCIPLTPALRRSYKPWRRLQGRLFRLLAPVVSAPVENPLPPTTQTNTLLCAIPRSRCSKR